MDALRTSQCIDDIVNAPVGLLRAVMEALCNDKVIRDTACRHLDRLACMERVAAQRGQSLKRKAEVGLHICVKCNEPFMDGDKSRDCLFHPGGLSQSLSPVILRLN